MDEVAGQWDCLCEIKTTENKEKPLIQVWRVCATLYSIDKKYLSMKYVTLCSEDVCELIKVKVMLVTIVWPNNQQDSDALPLR